MGRSRAKGILLLGVLGTAVSAILVRYSQAPSLVTATYRLGWTVLLLLPAALLRGGAEWKRVTRRDVGLCALSGVCLALHFALWFESLKWTSVASSTALVSTEVIFVALGFALLFGGRISRLGWGAIALAVAGSTVLAFAGGGAGGTVGGNGLALAGAAAVAAYTLIGRYQREHLSTTVYTALTYTACLITLLVLDGVTGTAVWGWPPREWLIGLGLAVFCTLMGHSLFSWCLRELSPAYVSAAKPCEPVFAAVLAGILFGEIPDPAEWISGGMVLAGVLLYTYTER